MSETAFDADRRMRVAATPIAEETVRAVRASGRRDLVLVLGTGCCDSTAPFLFDRYEPGADTVPVGSVAGVPVVAPGWLARLYADGARLVIDVDEGVLSDSLSLESELGCRFTLRLDADVGPPATPHRAAAANPRS